MCDRGALAYRRRDSEVRGFIQITPAPRWLLAAGDLTLEWAAGDLRVAEEDFDRFARTGVGPAGRSVLRAAGTLSWSRAHVPGIAVAAPLGRCGLGAWRVGRARGGGVWAGPIALACERTDAAAPIGISIAARVPGVLLLELAGSAGRRLAWNALAGRWKSPDRAGWGSLEGAFRLRSASGFDTLGVEEGWDLRWSPPSSASLRTTASVRTVRRGVNGPIPETENRLGVTITSAHAIGSLGASVTGEASERCRADPTDSERRVLSRLRRRVMDFHGRLNITPGLTLGLRYRQSGLEEDLEAADAVSNPDADDDTVEGAWERGWGDAMLGAVEWRSTRGIWAGLSLTAAAGGEALPTWVPARRPLGATQWVRLPSGGWLGEAWFGTRWRGARFEAVCRGYSTGVLGEASIVTLLGGLELGVR
jgi:hypothetical protein